MPQYAHDIKSITQVGVDDILKEHCGSYSPGRFLPSRRSVTSRLRGLLWGVTVSTTRPSRLRGVPVQLIMTPYPYLGYPPPNPTLPNKVWVTTAHPPRTHHGIKGVTGTIPILLIQVTRQILSILPITDPSLALPPRIPVHIPWKDAVTIITGFLLED